MIKRLISYSDGWMQAASKVLQGVQSSPRALTVVNAVFLLVAAVNLYRLWGPSSLQIYQADFHTYYNAARAVRGAHNPYDQTVAWMEATLQHRSGVPQVGQISLFVYPPFLAIILIPFTFMSYPAALFVWNLCNIAFLTGSLYFVLRIAAARVSATFILGLVAVALSLSPIHSELFFAQVDLALLCLVCASIWALIGRHPYVSGCLLAVGCVIKPILLLVLLFLVWKRAYRAAVVSVIVFFALLLIPLVWLGQKAMEDQVAIWQFWSSHYVVYFFNVSPDGVLARLFRDNIYVAPIVRAPALATILWLIIAAAVLGLMVGLVDRSSLIAGPRTALEFGIAITALLLVSPLSEDWYFSFLVVPLLASAIMLRSKIQSPHTVLYAACLLGIGLLICLPLFHIQGAVLDHITGKHTSRLVADVLMIASAIQLYITIGLLILQVLILREFAGVHPVASLRKDFARLVAWIRHSSPSAWV